MSGHPWIKFRSFAERLKAVVLSWLSKLLVINVYFDAVITLFTCRQYLFLCKLAEFNLLGKIHSLGKPFFLLLVLCAFVIFVTMYGLPQVLTASGNLF